MPASPYRPESADHFKELAKNVAWLFALPLQETQECLSRIYGYENLYELQANSKSPASRAHTHGIGVEKRRERTVAGKCY